MMKRSLGSILVWFLLAAALFGETIGDIDDRAQRYYNEKRFSEAIREWLSALEIDPTNEKIQAKVEMVIELASEACRDLGLPRARVAVCGLNPHAGEGGQMGTEEQTVISPAVHAVRSRKLDVVGPLAADALFYHAFKGEYDAVVAMYHDQGLGPLKMIGFESGVNWTLGLPFIRTSPDHGTAYNIAGQGIANPSSMVAAIRLAKQLARNR